MRYNFLMALLDSILTHLTMYRFMLYYLIILVVFGTIFNGRRDAIEDLI